MQRLMQGLCNVPVDKGSHPTGLRKECKGGNHPREEMKKQFLMAGYRRDAGPSESDRPARRGARF